MLLPEDKSLIYGIDVNNNPTVQDLWNSTPAFGFPFAASNATVPSLPARRSMADWVRMSLASVSTRCGTSHCTASWACIARPSRARPTRLTGEAGPLDGATSNVIVGGAPYYRLAYEHQWGAHSLSVGVYGATFKLVPGADGTGAGGRFAGPGQQISRYGL